MVIDLDLCTGCASCMLYCPVEAIVAIEEKTSQGKRKRTIDFDQCVECGNCLRAGVCPVDAVYQQPLEWPRSLRSAFSNPQTEHKSKDLGRGTEEMKTNEVTNRFKKGEVGVAIELGRPLLGASFRDVDRVTRAVGRLGVEFEKGNPLSSVIEEGSGGALRRDVLGERVLSTIVEFKIGEEKLDDVLLAVRTVADDLETVFSLGLIAVLPSNGHAPVIERVKGLGFEARPNGKVNLGLGRKIPHDLGPGTNGRSFPSERRAS